MKQTQIEEQDMRCKEDARKLKRRTAQKCKIQKWAHRYRIACWTNYNAYYFQLLLPSYNTIDQNRIDQIAPAKTYQSSLLSLDLSLSAFNLFERLWDIGRLRGNKFDQYHRYKFCLNKYLHILYIHLCCSYCL